MLYTGNAINFPSLIMILFPTSNRAIGPRTRNSSPSRVQSELALACQPRLSLSFPLADPRHNGLSLRNFHTAPCAHFYLPYLSGPADSAVNFLLDVALTNAAIFLL